MKVNVLTQICNVIYEFAKLQLAICKQSQQAAPVWFFMIIVTLAANVCLRFGDNCHLIQRAEFAQLPRCASYITTSSCKLFRVQCAFPSNSNLTQSLALPLLANSPSLRHRFRNARIKLSNWLGPIGLRGALVVWFILRPLVSHSSCSLSQLFD